MSGPILNDYNYGGYLIFRGIPVFIDSRADMSRPRLLWVDSTFGCPSPVPRTAAEAHFEVSARVPVSEAHAAVRQLAPAVVCFEFEHPDAAGLGAMRDFKVANPSLPLLMLTTQHSEALAVWAFRVRVWNYLVKPVAASELAANFAVLARIALEEREPSRPVRAIGALMPPDAKAAERMRESPLHCALRHVEHHFEQKLRQSSIAASAGMSSSAFSRAFKAEFGITFSQYLARYRIGRACHLLRQGYHSVTTVGQAVGFDDASHFARTFRALLGVSPSAFKRVGSDTAPVSGLDGRPSSDAGLQANGAPWLSPMTWEPSEELPAWRACLPDPPRRRIRATARPPPPSPASRPGADPPDQRTKEQTTPAPPPKIPPR